MGLPTKTPAEARVATARGPPAHVTFAACYLVFFITIIFLHNHNSMAYVHSTIQYSLEAPAGWLQSTSRTTVRAVTIKNAAGEAVTRAALTATTTTTTVATGAAAASSNNKGQTAEPNRLRPLIIRYVFGHLSQHHTAHAAQVAAAAAKAALPEANSDIELHPQRVAQVVQQAKAAEQLQQLTEQGAITQSTTTAEKYAGLYGAGGAGSVVFEPNSDLSRCPEGSAAPQGASAVVLLADSSSGAAVLKRSLDGLMLLYSQASADIRAAFHLFIGLDGGDQDMQQLAHQYALDSLGTLKLVHHRSSSSSSSSSGPGAATGPSEVQRNALRADHTRLMLHVFFNCFQYPSVLLLEDDWKLLPDFFEFFEATQWLLTSDPTLYCVSAWNPMSSCHHHPLQQQDHKHHNRCSSRLLRSDVNPGRGWLLGRATGLQLLKAWRQGQQLDWQQYIHSMGARYGQQCIVPESPRMLPAAVHDTAAGAHIVTAAGDVDAAGSAVDSEAAGAVRRHGHGAVQQPAAGKATGAGKHQAAAVMTGVADGGEGPGQDGVVDRDAESAPAVALQPAADGSDTPAALAAAGQQAAVQGQSPRSSWLGRDVSHMLAQPYRRRLHKRLLRAEAVDAVTAAGLTDTKAAACVSYSTAEQLSAAVKALGVPLTLTAGVRYCYMLPTTPATQHCQDFLPDLAYEGVVATYTPHGVQVYLTHLAYITALHSSTTPAVTPVKRQAPAAKAGKPA